MQPEPTRGESPKCPACHEVRENDCCMCDAVWWEQRSDSALLAEVRDALAKVLMYRAHVFGCEVGMTEFCNCGMKEAADTARRLVEALERRTT